MHCACKYKDPTKSWKNTNPSKSYPNLSCIDWLLMRSYKVLRPIGPMLNNINLHWHASEASRAGPSWELWDVLKHAGIKLHHLDMGYDSWGLANDHIRMNINLIDRLIKVLCLIVVLDVRSSVFSNKHQRLSERTFVVNYGEQHTYEECRYEHQTLLR